jgi:chromosome segregation ATPase
LTASDEKGGNMEKKAYIEKLEAELKEWSARIGDLAAKAEQMKEEKKREYREQLEMLRAKQEAAGKKLHDLKEASGKAWEDMKSGVDRAEGGLAQSRRTVQEGSAEIAEKTEQVDL